MAADPAFECVVNISEGRDMARIGALSSACGGALLDVHTDADHHRSVFTLGGPLDSVEAGARRLAEQALDVIDLRAHAGVHPRIGTVDVVPFVALDRSLAAEAVAAAQRFAAWMGNERGVPTFLYGEADIEGRSLPDVRRDAFERRPPDFGPGRPQETAGACAVGARPVMVAINCELDTDDLALARDVAERVRERDGGLAGVRALGLALAGAGHAQVSMNLVALEATGVEAACTSVRDLARAGGADVHRVELVGLMPASELERCSAGFVSWTGLTPDLTIEARLAEQQP